MIHGIDVSAYQPEAYSTAGLDFVFTKVTEGLGYVNPRWAAQRDRAKAAGLLWGAYHYPHMANDPKVEADYFLKQVKWAPGDLIVLDWEGYDAANKGVPKSRQLAYRDAWLKYVKGKMPSFRVGMYCNTDYWLNVDKTSGCGDFLWIATGGKPAGQPGIDHAWMFHQYSTAGGVDHDVATFTDRSALAAWAQGLTQENDMAVTDADALKIARKVLTLDEITAPKDAPDVATNPSWRLDSYTKDTNARVRGLEKQLAALAATNAKLVDTVAKLAAGIGGLDPAAIVAELKQAIESIDIHLDVPNV